MSYIRHYSGEEITFEVIERIKKFAKERYTQNVYDSCFSMYDSPESFAKEHGVPLNDQHIILGSDWVVCYHILQRNLIISDWIGENNSQRTVSQSIEMYVALRNILLSSMIKRINVFLRHDTSYKFYKLLLERNYVNLYYDIPIIDMYFSENIDKLLVTVNSSGTLEQSIKLGNIPKEYEQFIFHDISFELTEKFQKKYGRKK